MVGKITYYGFNGKIREVCRFIAREDFLKELKEAISCGEYIKYKVTSTDKAFRKLVKQTVSNAY